MLDAGLTTILPQHNLPCRSSAQVLGAFFAKGCATALSAAMCAVAQSLEHWAAYSAGQHCIFHLYVLLFVLQAGCWDGEDNINALCHTAAD